MDIYLLTFFHSHSPLYSAFFLSFFSPHCGLLLSNLGLFLTSLQDVFKEARSHDHVEAKSDMETHIRSRKLPLTRKIYAFYHAPIVKFWSNTVWRLQKRTHTFSHLTISFMVVYLGWILGNRNYKERMLLHRSSSLMQVVWVTPTALQRYRCVVGVITYRAFSIAVNFPENQKHFKGLHLVYSFIHKTWKHWLTPVSILGQIWTFLVVYEG